MKFKANEYYDILVNLNINNIRIITYSIELALFK